MDMDKMDEIIKEDFLRYDVEYESIWWPYLRHFHFYTRDDYKGEGVPLWWKFKVTNWLVRCWHSVYDYIQLDIGRDWLFDKMNWRTDIMPSFPDSFKKVLNNVLVFLTPWFRLRSRFISVFINCNSCKLLNGMRNWTHVRNRQPDCAYYTLSFFGFYYKLIKTVIKNTEGDSVNGFAAGISIAFDPNKTDEEKHEEVESFTEVKTQIGSGWVFGMKSALKEINKIVSLTPDLNWESPTKWHEKHPNYLEELMAETSMDEAEAKAEIKISDENNEDKR